MKVYGNLLSTFAGEESWDGRLQTLRMDYSSNLPSGEDSQKEQIKSTERMKDGLLDSMHVDSNSLEISKICSLSVKVGETPSKRSL